MKYQLHSGERKFRVYVETIKLQTFISFPMSVIILLYMKQYLFLYFYVILIINLLYRTDFKFRMLLPLTRTFKKERYFKVENITIAKSDDKDYYYKLIYNLKDVQGKFEYYINPPLSVDLSKRKFSYVAYKVKGFRFIVSFYLDG